MKYRCERTKEKEQNIAKNKIFNTRFDKTNILNQIGDERRELSLLSLSLSDNSN